MSHFVEYSPLCETDRDAYLLYLLANLNNGKNVDLGSGRLGDAVQRRVSSELEIVGAMFGSSRADGLGGFGGDTFVSSVERVVPSVERGLDRPDDGFVGSSVDEVDDSTVGDRNVIDSTCESFELRRDCGRSGIGKEGRERLGGDKDRPVRGPNWERNKKNRDAQRDRKGRRKLLGQDWRGGRAGVVDVDDKQVCSDESKGFWNSCSPDVRQQLIDSKARMHIADNSRREKESLEKIDQLGSPEAILRRAMRFVGIAEECAKKENDTRVAGWAKTLATSYAESVARSVPSTLPSLESSPELVQSTEFSGVSLAEHELVLKKIVDLEEQLKQKLVVEVAQSCEPDGVSFEEHENVIQRNGVLEEQLRKKAAAMQFGIGSRRTFERQLLQKTFDNEILLIELSYERSPCYDTSMLIREKQMLKKQKKYASLFA